MLRSACRSADWFVLGTAVGCIVCVCVFHNITLLLQTFNNCPWYVCVRHDITVLLQRVNSNARHAQSQTSESQGAACVPSSQQIWRPCNLGRILAVRPLSQNCCSHLFFPSGTTSSDVRAHFCIKPLKWCWKRRRSGRCCPIDDCVWSLPGQPLTTFGCTVRTQIPRATTL